MHKLMYTWDYRILGLGVILNLGAAPKSVHKFDMLLSVVVVCILKEGGWPFGLPNELGSLLNAGERFGLTTRYQVRHVCPAFVEWSSGYFSTSY